MSIKSIGAAVAAGLGALMLGGASAAEECYDGGYQGDGAFQIFKYHREDQQPQEHLEGHWFSRTPTLSLEIGVDVTNGWATTPSKIVVWIYDPESLYPKPPEADLYLKVAIGQAKPWRIKVERVREKGVQLAEIKAKDRPDLVALATRAGDANLTLEAADGTVLASQSVRLPQKSDWDAMRKSAAAVVAEYRSPNSCAVQTFYWDPTQKGWVRMPLVHSPSRSRPF